MVGYEFYRVRLEGQEGERFHRSYIEGGSRRQGQ